MIHIGQGFLLLDFETKSIHHSKPILEKLIKRTPTPYQLYGKPNTKQLTLGKAY
jgi:hypothetical protein